MKFPRKQGVPPIPEAAYRIEETAEGLFWCYFESFRSVGNSEFTDISRMLQWILQQTLLGHMKAALDEGDVVGLTFGKEVPRASENMDTAIEQARSQIFSTGIVGALARSREMGSSAETIEFEKRCWENQTTDVEWRLQMHYGRMLADLMGHVSKKLPDLQLFPLFDATEQVRECIAEATKCYLLKLDRACISLCRASLEECLRTTLTHEMSNELQRSGGSLKCLISICDKHGLLDGELEDAEFVRIAGNDILHKAARPNQAKEVLTKTRTLVGIIERNRRKRDSKGPLNNR